jgi:hypothetical protein
VSDREHRLSTTDTHVRSPLSEPSPLVFWLVTADAPTPELVGHRLLAHGLVVGRGEAEIFRDDRRLSRRHASFAETDAGLDVIDLGSHNGTWMQGARVTKRSLVAGDYVRLGSFGFVVARAPALRRLRSDDVLVGDSHAFQLALAELEALAASEVPALIWGPAGSGRSAFCERVHARSQREGTLEWVDPRGAPDDALRTSLLGAVERARGGTVVLDCVEAVSTSARTIVEATIAAAHRARCRLLVTSVREDALSAIVADTAWTVSVPSLAERRDDIPLLFASICRRLDARLTLTPDQVEQLVTRSFRGNVTELATLVERAHRSPPELRDSVLGVASDRIAPNTPVVLARSGKWFVAAGTRVDLGDSPTLAAVLGALVRGHISGRRYVDTAAIVADGWAGERILPRAARNRVYVAVSSLRSSGLRSIVVRTAEGYALEGDFVLED